MQVLCLESYYSGSHKAFLDGWSARSRHNWTILALPGYKWKWRMRHSAVTFAEQAGRLSDQGNRWDVIFCSDMVNLAEFLGLATGSICALPSIAYFHENQLTYPVRFESERDYQFAMTNITTALAADEVWFNSAYHRDSFLDAIEIFMSRMPDYQLVEAGRTIKAKSSVYPQGIEKITQRPKRKDGPIRILWAARWEHDKGAEDFFEALKILKQRGCPFRLSVIGQQFREAPSAFQQAREYFSGEIDRWGYQENRAEYDAALLEADVIVSTARHEFFGISVVEAIAAGAYPVVPMRLAYPDILNLASHSDRAEYFYDGSIEALAEKLAGLGSRLKNNGLWGNSPQKAKQLVEEFTWPRLAPVLDKAIDDTLYERPIQSPVVI